MPSSPLLTAAALLCCLAADASAAPRGAKGRQPKGEQRFASDLAYQRFIEGELAFARGRYREAYDLYRESLLHERADHVLRRRGEAELAMGWSARARETLRRVAKRRPRDLAAWRAWGRAALAARVWPEAARVWTKVRSQSPDDEEAYQGLVEAWGRMGQAEKASQACLAHRLSRAARARCWGGLAEALAAAERPEAAVAALKRLGDDPWALERSAELCEDGGDAPCAIRALEALLSRDAGRADLMVRLVRLHRGRGEVSAAAAVEARLRELDPRALSPFERVELAELHFEAGDPEATTAALKAAADFSPDVPLYALALGLHHRRLSRPEAALAALERVPPESRAGLQAALSAAELLQGLGRGAEARARLEQASALHPARVEPSLALAELAEASGDLEGALSTLRQALKRHPKSSDLRFELGMTLDRARRVDEAIAEMRRLLEADDRFVPALNYLGYAFAQRKVRSKEAERLLSRARDLEPENLYVLDSLGLLYLNTGKAARAVPLLERAAAGLPDHPEVLWHLGQALAGSGEKERAAELLTRLLRDHPEGPHVKAAQRSLRALRPSPAGATPGHAP